MSASENLNVRAARWLRLVRQMATSSLRVREVDRDDIIQDALIRLLERAPDFASEQHELGYIAALVRNTAIDHARKGARTRGHQALDLGAALEKARNAQDKAGDDVNEAIELLSDSDRLIAQLIIGGMSSSQVANHLQIAPADVHYTWQRVKIELRRLLESGDRSALTREADRAAQVADVTDTTLDIEIYVNTGAADASIIADLLGAINRLHVAAGGAGLEFNVDGSFVVAGREVTT